MRPSIPARSGPSSVGKRLNVFWLIAVEVLLAFCIEDAVSE